MHVRMTDTPAACPFELRCTKLAVLAQQCSSSGKTMQVNRMTATDSLVSSGLALPRRADGVPASDTTDKWGPTSRQPICFSTSAKSATRPVTDWQVRSTISSHPRPTIAKLTCFTEHFWWRRHVHAGSSVVASLPPFIARTAFCRSLNEGGRNSVADQSPATSCAMRSSPCRARHRTRGNPSDRRAKAGRGASACRTFLDFASATI